MWKLLKLKGIVAVFAVSVSQAAQAWDPETTEEYRLHWSNSEMLWLTQSENEPEQLSAWSEQDKHCLALNLWHEARHEPVEGQVAVAQVTLNRTHHQDFPSDVCGVVYQRTTNAQRKTTTCQFTWTCQKLRQPKPDEATWLQVVHLVERFVQGEFKHYQEKYQNSLNYHAYYVNPKWNLKKLTRIGAHIFYQRY
jgi:spore germination cell wall hydrolase CwlJ-like protein